MNLEDFKHVSESVKKRNPHLYGSPLGGLETSHAKPAALPALDVRQAAQPSREAGVEYSVVMVAHLWRRFDDDNLVASLKPLRDAIAASIGIDDGDKRIQWHYYQIIDRYEGVAVKITAIRQMT